MGNSFQVEISQGMNIVFHFFFHMDKHILHTYSLPVPSVPELPTLVYYAPELCLFTLRQILVAYKQIKGCSLRMHILFCLSQWGHPSYSFLHHSSQQPSPKCCHSPLRMPASIANLKY